MRFREGEAPIWRRGMVTILDVSRKAGVSTATVSRVLNHPDMVDEKTRDLVRLASEELGYRPNRIARDLARRSSQTIGVVVNNFASPYYGMMLDGVDEALAASGWNVIAETSRETAAGELRAIQSLMDRQCDAIVVHANSLEDEALTELFGKYPRLVLMNRLLEPFNNRCVHLDNELGGRIAAGHLIAKGHVHMAMIAGPETFHEVRARHRGFAGAIAEAGLALPDSRIVRADFSLEGGRGALAHLMQRDSGITAVFAHNDEMAVGATEEADRMGLSVPKDLSVIGFDDMTLARLARPALTTIGQPLRAIGAACGRLAHALSREADTSKIQRVFDAELIERETVTEPRR